MSTKVLPTDEELMALPKDGFKRELLNGEIVMSPAGSEHGRQIMRFSFSLMGYVFKHQLGEVFDGQTGFRMQSRDVLIPDISFVGRDRLVGLREAPEGFYEGAPDLAIEFRSSSDPVKRLNAKLDQYFKNGTKLAWVMNSKRRTVAVHRSVVPDRVLTSADELTGDEMLPGFRNSVADIFAGFSY